MKLRRAVYEFFGTAILAGAAHAVDCGPYQQIMQRATTANMSRFLVADALNIDESTAAQPVKVDSVEMTVRQELEAKLLVAQQAVTYAQRAVREGIIDPGGEHEFIRVSRRLTSLKLKIYHADVAAIAVLVNPSGDGVVLRRKYVFPNDETSAEMGGDDEMCELVHLKGFTRPTSKSPARASDFLDEPERPDCASQRSLKSMQCASLSKHLQDAAIAKEIVIATARDADSTYIFTSSTNGHGRFMITDRSGTTVMLERYFHAKTTLK